MASPKYYAASRIEYGALDKDGKNVVTVFETGQPITGLADDVVKGLVAMGAVGVLAAPTVEAPSPDN